MRVDHDSFISLKKQMIFDEKLYYKFLTKVVSCALFLNNINSSI